MLHERLCSAYWCDFGRLVLVGYQQHKEGYLLDKADRVSSPFETSYTPGDATETYSSQLLDAELFVCV